MELKRSSNGSAASSKNDFWLIYFFVVWSPQWISMDSHRFLDFSMILNGAQIGPSGAPIEEFKWSSNGTQWSFNGARGRGRFKECYKIYKIYNI